MAFRRVERVGKQHRDRHLADAAGYRREVSRFLRRLLRVHVAHQRPVHAVNALSPELQRRRILARNGEAMARCFFERWIPLEQAYFDAMKPQARCGFLIEADQLSDEAPL